jgi:hypothetical protein
VLPVTASTQSSLPPRPTLLYHIDASQRFVLLVHGHDSPSDADWTRYLDALVETRKHQTSGRILVVTDAVGPSAAQRETMNSRFIPIKVPVAVLTSSPVARSIVTILSWFNPLIRVFPPHRLHDALTHLEIDHSQTSEIVALIGGMRMRLAGVDVASNAAAAELLAESAIAPMDAVVIRLSKLREDIEKRRGGRRP